MPTLENQILQKHNFQANLSYSAEYLEYIPENSPEDDRVYIFLHGYGENADVFYKRVLKVFQPKCRSFFLNGCFPIPTIRNDVVVHQFAWYFYNPQEQRYYIDFNVPNAYIANLISSLNIQDSTKITLIGYSQGGYLAPFVAAGNQKIDHVVVLNASIREDRIEKEVLNFKLDQIHAANDERIEYELAKERFDKISSRVQASNWISVENETHFLSENLIKTLEKILS